MAGGEDPSIRMQYSASIVLVLGLRYYYGTRRGIYSECVPVLIVGYRTSILKLRASLRTAAAGVRESGTKNPGGFNVPLYST